MNELGTVGKRNENLISLESRVFCVCISLRNDRTFCDHEGIVLQGREGIPNAHRWNGVVALNLFLRFSEDSRVGPHPYPEAM